MKSTYFFLVAAVLIFASCETDVELNAPYKNTTIIYGLLDSDANGDNVSNTLDTQWVRINKTFLGEGNNNAYAAVRDSSEYQDDDFEVKIVQKLDDDGDVLQEFELLSKTISNRNLNGIFYGPEQTVYYFVPTAPGLDQNADYRIYLKFKDGREVSGLTSPVSYNNFSWLTPQQNATLVMAQISINGGVIYTSESSVRWNAATNANIYDARLRFHYTELLYDNDSWSGAPISTTDKSVDFYLGSVEKNTIIPGEQLKISFAGEAFFTFLQNNIEVNNRIRRVIGHYDTEEERTECFDLLLTMGNDDLKSYIEVNTPATGIVQERPIYTNISNGIGLFASRGSRNLIDLSLIAVDNNNQENPGNLYALMAELTAALNFCDPNPTSDFPCN